MSAMKIGAVVALLAGIAGFGIQGLAAEETQSSFKPLHAISLHVGTKQGVAYFEPVSGVCELTLVIGEDPTTAAASEVTSARIRTSVRAGQRTRVDTGEGKELAFYCGPAAVAMSVETMQQTAFTPAR